MGDELFQVDGLDGSGLGDALFGEISVQLAQIAVVGHRSGRRTAVIFEVGEELL